MAGSQSWSVGKDEGRETRLRAVYVWRKGMDSFVELAWMSLNRFGHNVWYMRG